jgi:protein TonB
MKRLLLLCALLISLISIAQEEVKIVDVESPPIYPGCKRGSNAKTRRCMSNKIAKFVVRNFNKNLAKDLGLYGKQRIGVIFKIGIDGKVYGVRSRGPHPKLENEAIRIINMLPQMDPGLQKGEPVIVRYFLPITFFVDGTPTITRQLDSIKRSLEKPLN